MGRAAMRLDAKWNTLSPSRVGAACNRGSPTLFLTPSLLEAAKKEEMKKFEYKYQKDTGYSDIDWFLNWEGQDGWELVWASKDLSSFIWKRALPESNDKTETK